MTWLKLLLFLNLVVFYGSSTGLAQISSPTPTGSKPPLLIVDDKYGGTGNSVGRFSPNGQTLARFKSATSIGFMSASSSSTDLSLYDLTTGNKGLIIANGWRGFVFSPDSLKLFCWDDKSISIWNIKEAQLVSTLQVPNINQISFVRDGEWFVTESTTRPGEAQPIFFKFWDAKSLKPVDTPIDQKGPWLDPVVTPDGKIFVGFERENCLILDVTTGTALPAPLNVTPSQTFTPRTRVTSDGKYVIFNARYSNMGGQPNLNDSLLIFWSLATSKPIKAGPLLSLKTLSNADTSSLIAQQLAPAYLRNGFDLSSVFVDNEDKRWIVKRIMTDETLQEFPDKTTWQPSDESTIDQVTSDRMVISLRPRSTPTIKGLDLRDGSQTTILETKGAIRNAAITRDGHRLAITEVCSPPNQPISERIAIWDIRSPKQISSIDRYQSFEDYYPIESICFWSNDRLISNVSRRLATGLSEPEVLMWESSTGRQLKTEANQELPSTIVAVSDDQTLLASPRPNELHILDSKNLTLKQKLVIKDFPSRKGYVTPELGKVRLAAFSPDNSRLAAVSFFNNDSYLSYWDLSAGELCFLTKLESFVFDIRIIDQGKSIQLAASQHFTGVVIRSINALEKKGKGKVPLLYSVLRAGSSLARAI